MGSAVQIAFCYGVMLTSAVYVLRWYSNSNCRVGVVVISASSASLWCHSDRSFSLCSERTNGFETDEPETKGLENGRF